MFKRNRARFETPECPSCGSDKIVIDPAQGHQVCDDCGVILRQSMIAETTEYRTFAEPDKPTGDPTRVAAGPLGTRVQDDKSSGAQSLSKKARLAGASGHDRHRAAFKVIGDTVQKMELPADVRETAECLYCLYAEQNKKVVDMRAAVGAAVFQACKDCNVTRTLKELALAMSAEKDIKKSISRAHRELHRILQARAHAEALRQGVDLTSMLNVTGGQVSTNVVAQHHPASNVPRFASDLGFTKRGIQIAKKIAYAVKPDEDVNGQHMSWHGKQPMTLTAVTLYIASHLGARVLTPGIHARTIADVADVCGVSEGTIESTYAEMFIHVRAMLADALKPPLTDDEWDKFPIPDAKHGRKLVAVPAAVGAAA